MKACAIAIVWLGALGCTPRETAKASDPAPEAAVEDEEKPPKPERVSCTAIEGDIASAMAAYDAAAATLSDAAERDRVIAQSSPLRICHHAGGGAWLLMPKSVRVGRNDDGSLASLDVPFRPTYLRPDSGLVTGELELTFHVDVESEHDEYSRSDFNLFVQLPDYDDDGEVELVLTTELQAHEDFRRTNMILTAAGGRVRAYPPLADVDLETIIDVDKDGRPDVVSIKLHYPGERCFEMEAFPVGLPEVLYHAKEDGSFSFSDDVARTFLAKQCSPTPPRLLDADRREDDGWDMVARKTIACARLFGANADDLAKQIRREWKQLPKDAGEASCGTTLEQFLAIARKDPIVAL